MKEALISIKPEFANKICTGEKTVELRSRKINIKPGTRLWLYSTLPSGSLDAFAIINKVEYESPQKIWERYSEKIYLSKHDFDNYTNGCERVTAIIFGKVIKIQPALSLASMRNYHTEFQPPQFYKWITSESPLAAIFNLIAKDKFENYELSFVVA